MTHRTQGNICFARLLYRIPKRMMLSSQKEEMDRASYGGVHLHLFGCWELIQVPVQQFL
jgi:hypothetical protein